jgi:hydroxypyruvate isomerase
MYVSACIEWLFAEADVFAERVLRAEAAGIPAVEFWTWRDKDLDAIAQALRATSTELACFCCDPPGRLIDPATHADFLVGLRESIDVAHRLGCGCLIIEAGDRQGISDQPRVEYARAALFEVLQAAAELAEAEQVVLVLEPLNTELDHPDSFLSSTDLALELIGAVASPGVRLLLDIYHSQMMGEADPDVLLRGREQLLGHVHVADMPGRAEPGTGEIDWTTMVDSLRRSGYDGAIGLEFMPSIDTADALRRTAATLQLQS